VKADDVALLRALERDLRIPSWAETRSRELRLYLEARGRVALVRQVELGMTHHRCCWNHVDEGHAPACPESRKADA